MEKMDVREYIKAIGRKWAQGNATEHSYRGCLEQMVQGLLPGLLVTNEPKRVACGAPDYIVTRKDGQPVFYIEAKDIGDGDLDGRNAHGNKEQFSRYKASLDHIVFTDYLDFHFYEHGEWVENVRIGEVHGDKIDVCEDGIERFLSVIRLFAEARVQAITTASRLAEIMAAKARLLRHNISKALLEEEDSYDNRQLRQLFDAFKDALIKDLEVEQFADMYAQTIAYGLFAARLHDDTSENFTRAEAVQLIPKSNPFLRQVFNSIAGIDLDRRVAWVVDDLVQAFAATDVSRVMAQYGNDRRHNDPMVHFYEDFLHAYDPRMRERLGVYYTPQPVVTFIVRAVDDILKRDFGIGAGLADKKIIHREVIKPQEYDNRTKDGMKHVQKPYHRVQILDPATGTGTFLAEVINTIYDEVAQKNAGIWQDYVGQHLLPRLNGFEILMASYAVAHLKLDMVLQATGYRHDNDKRFNIFLTNSLERGSYEKRTLFSQALSAEMEQASEVKNDKPVMVMMGNPPYSVSSSNKGKWITELMDDYKRNLGERNIQPLSDDYIKFIRLGQHYIEKNGQGILAFISNNSFIDGIIHRQMRKSLLETFDDIYILDLHGSTKKKETTPDGGKDENVFDIQQGVSINIFVKTKRKASGELGKVYHHELYGDRKYKYTRLNDATLSGIAWNTIDSVSPNYFFVPKDFSLQEEYEKGILIKELIPIYSSGVKTSNDAQLVSMKAFERPTNRQYYFRPFDIRYIDYDINKVGRPRKEVMQLFEKENMGLLVCKQAATEKFGYFVTEGITDINYTGTAGQYGAGLVFPLFVLKERDGKKAFVPNLNETLLEKVEEVLGEQIVPQELFDYIYAILHSPHYRTRYKEFLKIDFPRIPYPSDVVRYHALAAKGGELRRLHLMEDADEWDTEAGFPVTEGDNVVSEIRYDEAAGRVYINPVRYFSLVPKLAWEFYIGGYQPAQKWLKDRRGTSFSADDVEHYERIIHALTETHRLMADIDGIGV